MQIKNQKSKIANIFLIFVVLLLSTFAAHADSSLSHNVGNVEMLISDWGAFTRIEGSEIHPGFRYFGRDYLDPFSEIWVRCSSPHVASAYDASPDGVSAGEWLATSPSGHAEYIPDHPNASQCIHAQYAADRYGDFPYDITVDQYTYAWDATVYPDDGDYIIMELVLTNRGHSKMEGVTLAVQTNWDVDYSEQGDDLMDWDAARRAGIAYDSDATDSIYVALALISGKFASHNIVNVNTWEYRDSDRANLMSNGETDDLETINAAPGNYFNVISTGTYTIPAGESVSVIYAFAAGSGFQELMANIDAAEKKIMTPGRLAAESSENAIHLEWSPSISGNAAAYRIYRGNTSGDYLEIAQVSAENMTYSDTQIETGVTYYYVVAAVGSDGAESDYSNAVHTASGVPPPPPQSLVISDGVAPILDWEPPADGEIASYVVYRNFTGSAPWTAIATLDASAQTFVDQGVYDENTYYYVVASTNAYGWVSEYSNTVSVSIDLPKPPEPAANLNVVTVAPNPCKLSSVARLRFLHLTATAKIHIYTASGVPVKTLYHANGTGAAEWDMRNDAGGMLASGIYIYYVESYKPEETGKFIASGKFALMK